MLKHNPDAGRRHAFNLARSTDYKFAAVVQITKAKPTPEQAKDWPDYRAIPDAEDGVTVYGFKTADERDRFVEQFGGVPVA